MSLTDLANKYKTDKGTFGPAPHGFTDFYESFFSDIKDDVKKVLEIGVGPGDGTYAQAASLKMWNEYFSNAIIHGGDYQDFSNINTDKIKTHICDQFKNETLQALINNTGNDFDLIIDDGCHNTIAQQTTFGFLFPYVKSGGYYIIEDLHTSVWGGWGLPANDESSAYSLVLKMQNNKKVETTYLSDEEKKYISENFEYCKVYDNEKDHITSIIKKL